MFDKLEEALEDYKRSNPDASIDYQLYGGENVPLLVSIITMLVKRVHKYVQQSSELVLRSII